jgi:hypothetical protein
MRNPIHPLLEQMRDVAWELDWAQAQGLPAMTGIGTNNGWFVARKRFQGKMLVVRALGSTGCLPDYPWEHVSVSCLDPLNGRRPVTPTWDVMCWVKELFWEDEETVMQLHPPKSEWVNDHETCLHLWKPLHVEIARPPAILVGNGSLEAARKAGGFRAQGVGKNQSRKGV